MTKTHAFAIGMCYDRIDKLQRLLSAREAVSIRRKVLKTFRIMRPTIENRPLKFCHSTDERRDIFNGRFTRSRLSNWRSAPLTDNAPDLSNPEEIIS